jgi:exopolysaccharide biosynthesis protein
MRKNKKDIEEIPKALRMDNTEKKKKKNVKKVLLVLVILAIIGVSTGGFLLYGPYSGFRDWLITTAMTTMTHQYFATWFYDDETIKASLAKNKVEEVNEITNTNTIVINNTVEETVYENEYERAVLEKDPNNDDYKIIEINGKGYSGYLAVIYDPSRIKTVYTKKLGTSGQYLKQMAKDNDALIAINGGGFEDPNFNSNGADPLGITFSGGKLITSKTWRGTGGLIGFTEDNKLVLGKMTVKQAQEMKVRDGVTFGPFLIINGKKSTILGNGGWGTAPRTAIGQRKDGIVLFLVIDGRTVTKPGANMNDLIEIMENYGAYNAANLDGGTSSAMVVNGEIINDPIDSTGAHRTRFISTGFILTK